jgi:class I lanthipeptide synthase
MEKKAPKGKWLPIAVEPEAGEIFAIINKLAEALHRPPSAWIPREREMVESYRIVRGASLAHGSSGIALFYTYLSQISNTSPIFADEADRFISHACDALGIVPMQGGLYRGLSGIAWTVQHLQGLLYDDESDDPETDPNEEIDSLLAHHWAKLEKFDVWEGCVGLGVYALERYPHSNSKILLELLIKQLDRLAVHTGKGIAWFTPPGTLPGRTKSIYPGGFYSLGVAHGISGVISFLSRVHALGILPDTTAKLLDGAVSWLLAQQCEKGSPLIFPQFLLPPDNKPLSTGTFGWCHGDLGLAAALISAAGCTGESSWKTKAIEAANASVDYLNKLSETACYDPCLCHGTAGLGHLFNRIYQSTGIEPFKEEAWKWFQQTIKLRNPGRGIAGFSNFGINEDGELVELYDPGFIQGATGIGLALLAAVTDLEPKWDRVMLISAPEKKSTGEKPHICLSQYQS